VQAGEVGRGGAVQRIIAPVQRPHPALRATFSRTGEGLTATWPGRGCAWSRFLRPVEVALPHRARRLRRSLLAALRRPAEGL